MRSSGDPGPGGAAGVARGAAPRGAAGSTPAGASATRAGPTAIAAIGAIGGAIAGAFVAGVANAFVYANLAPGEMLREKLLAILTGNLLVAAAAGVVLATVASRFQRLRARTDLGWWVGVALGAGPLATTTLGDLGEAWLGADRFESKFAGYAAIFAVGAIGLRWLALRLAPGAFAAAGAASLAAYGAVWLLPRGPVDTEPPPLPRPSTHAGDGAAAIAVGSDGGPAAAGDRPIDLVLVSIDTLRASALRDLEPDLPTFARLRARSRSSEFAWAPAPHTLPSHLTLFSGENPFRHGVSDNDQIVPPDVPFLAEILRDAGYRTAGVVSNSVLRRRAGFARGFDAFDDTPLEPLGVWSVVKATDRETWLGWLLPSDEARRFVALALVGLPAEEIAASGQSTARRTVRVASRYLRDLAADPAPYFLFVHLIEPHMPYRADPSVEGRLTAGTPMPAGFEGTPLDHDLHMDLQDRLAGDEGGTREAVEGLRLRYLEEVLFVDRCLGQLLDALDATGRPFAAVVTADHGEQFGEHARLGHGDSLYEPVLRVPFFLLGPGVEAGGRFADPPRHEDVAPTLLAFAGLPRGADMAGRDLRRDTSPPPVRIARSRSQIALHEGRWKLVATLEGGRNPRRLLPRQLFDLEADPGETRNLLDSERDVVERLAAIGEETIRAGRHASGDEIDADTRRTLEELGYAGAAAEDDGDAAHRP